MNFKDKLIQIFKNNNINITEKQAEQFNIFYENLIETNKIHNLTTITDENDVIIKHFLDSILSIDNIKANAKVLDIGCGAGFPSIPIKIMRPDLNVVAIDSVGKKIDFVRNIAKILNFDSNFTCFHTRIEDFAKKTDIRESFDYVVSRAVAPLNVILEYSAPFLKNNGYIYSYKGVNYNEELENSANALKILGCKLDNVTKYYIPEIDTTRYILHIQKLNSIPAKYPRPQNKPRTNPL